MLCKSYKQSVTTYVPERASFLSEAEGARISLVL